MADALRAPQLRPAIFVKIDLSGGALRLWTGQHDRKGGPGTGEAAQTYLGRRLLNFPALVQLANAKAHRVELELDGAHTTIAALLNARAGEIPGADITISYGVMQGGAPHPDEPFPFWVARYVGETPGFRLRQGPAVVVISAATPTIIRRRPANAFWTHTAQLRDHPGDLACERVPNYNVGVTRLFVPGPNSGGLFGGYFG